MDDLKSKVAYLNGLANGGMPFLNMELDPANPVIPEDKLSTVLSKVRIMCALHKRVALLEMTNHE